MHWSSTFLTFSALLAGAAHAQSAGTTTATDDLGETVAVSYTADPNLGTFSAVISTLSGTPSSTADPNAAGGGGGGTSTTMSYLSNGGLTGDPGQGTAAPVQTSIAPSKGTVEALSDYSKTAGYTTASAQTGGILNGATRYAPNENIVSALALSTLVAGVGFVYGLF